MNLDKFFGVIDSPLGIPLCNAHFGLCYVGKPSFLFRMDACVYMYRAGWMGRYCITYTVLYTCTNEFCDCC